MVRGDCGFGNEATGQLSFLDDSDPIKLYEHVVKATAAQLLNAQPWYAIAALIVEQIRACKLPIPPASLQVADVALPVSLTVKTI